MVRPLTCEQPDQQRGAPVGHVRRPRHLVAQHPDLGGQFQQLGLVVGELPRQQPPPFGVDQHAVMMRLPRSHISPYPGQSVPR
jgi:hypothetical protein